MREKLVPEDARPGVQRSPVHPAGSRLTQILVARVQLQIFPVWRGVRGPVTEAEVRAWALVGISAAEDNVDQVGYIDFLCWHNFS